MNLPVSLAVLLDGVIALTLLEGVGLAIYYRVSARGVAPREYGFNLVSGLCLMLALRTALHNSTDVKIALWLTAAGLAHGADLYKRWRR